MSTDHGMTRVIGRSGVEFEVDESTAASLVAQQVASYADEPGTGETATDPDIGDDQSTVTEPPPAENAPKTEWVTYACKVHGARFAEAKNLTRDELIERYGRPAGTAEGK